MCIRDSSDTVHFLKSGNELIAQNLYDEVVNNIYLNKPKPLNLVSSEYSNEILEKCEYKLKEIIEAKYESAYLNYLNKIDKPDTEKDDIIGSIVANCNPFTLGHLRIMEYASSQVDFLYVFVVEEDLSYFSFKDRLLMVKENLKHRDNIIVNPSGDLSLIHI